MRKIENSTNKALRHQGDASTPRSEGSRWQVRRTVTGVVRLWRGDVALMTLCIDEIDHRSVHDVRLRVRHFHRHSVVSPHSLEVKGRTGEEVPRGNRIELIFARKLCHARDAREVLIDVDRHEDDLRGDRAQVVVCLDELRRHEWADIDTMRIHELEDDGPPFETTHRECPTTLVGEFEIRRDSRGNGRQGHDVRQ